MEAPSDEDEQRRRCVLSREEGMDSGKYQDIEQRGVLATDEQRSAQSTYHNSVPTAPGPVKGKPLGHKTGQPGPANQGKAAGRPDYSCRRLQLVERRGTHKLKKEGLKPLIEGTPTHLHGGQLDEIFTTEVGS